MSKLTPRELRAAAIVTSVLGGVHAAIRDKPGAPDGTRDFDIIFKDSPPEPLEVSTFANRPAVDTAFRMGQADILAPSLARVWTIEMPESETDSKGTVHATKVREFIRDAEPLLRELELAGCDGYGFARLNRDPTIAAAIATLNSRGSTYGMSHDAVAPGTARLHVSVSQGGRADPDRVPLAVEAVAISGNKLTNADKLREPTQARRRHLFVSVSSSQGLTLAAIADTLRARLPVLPDPITTAWVDGGEVVFVTTPPGDWQQHSIPDDVALHPERWVKDDD